MGHEANGVRFSSYMKTHTLLALSLCFAGPLALIASSTDDRKIETAARASYNFRTVLEDHVKVKADDGVVTLTGSVQDREDKELAEDTVANLPGVSHVRNNIQVEATYPERSDAWIAWKIRGRLLVKGNVSATNTKVVSENGVVTLTGNADNVAQKELTAAYAQDIDGVKSVKNDMVINEKSPKGETMGENIDDASITTQVKFALLSHKSTSALKTKVSTTNGAIFITGEASSDAEKSLVTKLAQDVRGVKSVSNKMTVKA
ncbi:MAG TPA: BON domain-containing protein [Opitutaceae bacterium]|nr:BON domain-containing protein [Opitutaceae bacterium]